MRRANSSGNSPADLARRGAVMLILTFLLGFVSYTAAKALIAPWQLDDFPDELLIKAELLPLIFPVHMISGALALILVPAAILARRWPRWHRPVGIVAALSVLIGGISAFPVALVEPVTTTSALGFCAQGAVWLALLALGIRNIRRRRARAHRAAMLLMAAATSGAVFFRVYLALFAIAGDWRHYHLFYALDAWLAWSLPLIAMAWWLKRAGISPFDHQ